MSGEVAAAPFDGERRKKPEPATGKFHHVGRSKFLEVGGVLVGLDWLIWATERVNSRRRRELIISWPAACSVLTWANATPRNSDTTPRGELLRPMTAQRLIFSPCASVNACDQRRCLVRAPRAARRVVDDATPSFVVLDAACVGRLLAAALGGPFRLQTPSLRAVRARRLSFGEGVELIELCLAGANRLWPDDRWSDVVPPAGTL